MSKPAIRYTLGKFLASMSVAALGLGASMPASAQGQEVDEVERMLSHFNCYDVKLQQDVSIAYLQDQFDLLDQQFDYAFVFSPFQFCNPAEKQDEAGNVTPIVNRLNHLTFYYMQDFPAGPEREVVVVNQFGEQRLRVLPWAYFLGVPTEKFREGRPEGIDHFKCYIAQGEPLEREVKLFDQFFPNGLTAKVRHPRLLCNPTRKIHAGNNVGVQERKAHLVCYTTSRTPYENQVRIDNQFVDAGSISVGAAQSLCVPSVKRIVGTQLPDLIVRLPSRAQVSCPGGGGTCTQSMAWEVRELNGVAVNQGFRVAIGNSQGQSAIVNLPGIAAGGVLTGTATLGPPGGNCYDPNCTTRALVDIPLFDGVILESNESNNTAIRLDQG